MKNKEWDEEEKIRKLIRSNANPPHKFPRVGYKLDESQVESVARAFITFLAKDRRYQKSEILKRLPDIVDLTVVINKFRCKKTKYFGTPREIGEAIHDLIEEKLSNEKTDKVSKKD